MAALPDNGGPRMRAEPLGSLLASRGHITQEQLDIALTEQKATGRPLGEIIVARGFAPGPTVAQALATQHGGLLKTEYGFATGWSGQESNGAPPVTAPAPPSHDETASLRASLAEHQKALEAWKQSHAQLEERLAQAGQQEAPAADDARVAELEAERDALKAERDSFKAERDAFKVELAETRKPAAPPANDPRLAQLIADRESTQAELAKRDESIEQLKAELASAESGRKELERSLAKEAERTASVQAELEELKAAPAPEPEPEPAGRWDAAESHLVFFQGAEGYELVERSGPPPSEGSTVDSRLVARIASAPFPGSAVPCAYLVA